MLRQYRLEWIERAFAVLNQHAPELFDHATMVFTGWEYAPNKCTRGAAACTGGRDQWRVLTFRADPLTLPLVELATLIAHEALHYEIGAAGSLRQIDHDCSDPLCSRTSEKGADRIYRAHRLVAARLRARVPALRHPLADFAMQQVRPAATWSGTDLLIVAAAAASLYFAPKLLAAAR